MALQIANPAVVAKVERLTRATGLTKTAVVERAIDRLAERTAGRVLCPVSRTVINTI